MGRAPCCDKANVKRGPWSPEEDAKLKSHIEKHGTGGNWIALPQKIGLRRCGKSCRLRWLNYLRPNIKHGGFTEDEDNLICNLYISIGSRWSIIAAQLPGRTDNDIKNYWNTRLKKKLVGKQRRDQDARRDLNFANKQLEGTKKGFYFENYPSNEFFGTYPNPPQISDVYKSQENQNCYMPSFEPTHAYTNDHIERKYEIIDSFTSIPDIQTDQHQDIYKNSICMPGNNFQDFDEIPQEIIYYNMPQVESFSGLDLVNSNTTTTTTVSQELGTVWEDMNSLIYPPVIPVQEFCQPKFVQEWTYFEEPRLPGY